MPEARPEFLGAFLSKITRRISIDRFRAKHRERRGGMNEILSELDECIPSEDGVEREYESRLLRDEINSFLIRKSVVLTFDSPTLICRAISETDFE